MAVCHVCFRHCHLEEGGIGFCGARICQDGRVTAKNYGRITSLALDPVEKKPLHRFYPGSYILSAGSYGCNLRCPFCQNYRITWSDEAFAMAEKAEILLPEKLAELAWSLKDRGNIGVAFTYNEPLIGYEYIMDTARLLREKGMKTVLVTNGTAELSILEEMAPYIDAMNIDMKGFTDQYYNQFLQGDRKMVMDFITRAVQVCHVELTTLIVTGENDTAEEMRLLSRWIAGLAGADGTIIGSQIPLHISRFFPQFHLTDKPATDVKKIFELVEVAKEKLEYVYPGNV